MGIYDVFWGYMTLTGPNYPLCTAPGHQGPLPIPLGWDRTRMRRERSTTWLLSHANPIMHYRLDKWYWEPVTSPRISGLYSSQPTNPPGAKNQNIPGELGQYHDWWCPGSLRRQAIISHDIEHVA